MDDWRVCDLLDLPAAPPAAAGKVRNRIGLSSPRIDSSDLKARLNFDEDTRNGRLLIRDADGENAVPLDAGLREPHQPVLQ